MMHKAPRWAIRMGHRSYRIIKPVVKALLIVFGLLLLFLAFFAGNRWGREYLLDQGLELAVFASPYTLRIEKSESPEADLFRLQGIVLEDRGRTLLAVDWLELRLNWGAIRRLRLDIERLHLRGVNVDADPQAWAGPPAEEPVEESASTGDLRWLNQYSAQIRDLELSEVELKHPALKQPFDLYLRMDDLRLRDLIPETDEDDPGVRLIGLILKMQGDQHVLQGDFRENRVNAQLLLDRFPLDLLDSVMDDFNTGTLSADLRIVGRLDALKAGGTLDADSVLLQRPLQAAARILYRQELLELDVTRAQWGGLEASATGTVDVAEQSLDLVVNKVKVAQAFVESFGVEFPPELKFSAKSDSIAVRGPFKDPSYAGPVSATARYRNIPLQLEAVAEGTIRDLTINQSRLLAGKGSDQARLGTSGTIDFAGPINLRLQAKNLNHVLLRQALPSLPEAVSQDLEFSAAPVLALTGTFQAPELAWQLGATGGYRDQVLRLASKGRGNTARLDVSSLSLFLGPDDQPELTAKGKVNLKNRSLDFRIDASELPLSLARLADIALPDGLNGNLSAQVTAKGPWQLPAVQARANAAGLLDQTSWSMAAEGGFVDQQIAIKHLDLDWDQQRRLAVSAELSSTKQTLDILADKFDLAMLNQLGIETPGGTIDADLRLALDDRDFSADGSLNYAVERAVETESGQQVPVRYVISNELATRDRTLLVKSATTQNEESISTTQIRAPIIPYRQWLESRLRGSDSEADGAELASEPRPLPLPLELDGTLDLKAFQILRPNQLDRIGGLARFKLESSGTLPLPALDGVLALEGAFYENDVYGLALQDIELETLFDGQRVRVGKGLARTRDGGTITLAGEAGWAGDRKIDLHLEADDARLLDRPDIEASVSGKTDLTGDRNGYLLAGTAYLQPLFININSSFTSGVPEIEVEEGTLPEIRPAGEVSVQASEFQEVIRVARPGQSKADQVAAFPLKLKLDVITENQAYLRGRGLDAELEGRVKVRGMATAARTSGHFNIIRGRMDVFGKRFELKEGRAEFSDAGVLVNLNAQHVTPETTFNVHLSGPLDDFELDLTSSPVLPQDEVLSRLLFGKSVASISPVQALRLATAVQSLQGGNSLIPDPLETARNVVGVDELTVEQEETDEGKGLRVGVGKYLTDRIYVEVERTPDPERPWQGQLDVELTPQLKLQTTTSGGTGEGGVELQWSKDY